MKPMSNLRALRTRAGLSVADLARQADTSESTIKMLETGHSRNPGYFLTVRLARVLGVQPDSLFLPGPSSTSIRRRRRAA